MLKYCPQCGSKLEEENLFCKMCGQSVKKQGQTQLDIQSSAQTRVPSETKKTTMKIASGLITNTSFASAASGEMNFPFNTINQQVMQEGVLNVVGPFKLLIGGIVSIIRGFKTAAKNKKILLTTVILAIIWIALTLLPVIGVNLSSKWLYWLTFAKGGMAGTGLTKIGGVLGKGVFAYFITTIIASIAARKNPIKEIFSGFKRVFTSVSFKDLGKLSFLLFGMSAAFIAYNFLTGNCSLQLSVIGVIGFLSALRSMSQRYGFIRRFFSSLITKRGKTINDSSVTVIMSGWALGFLLSVPLSAMPVSFIGYYSGAGILILGILFKILSLNKKEVEVHV